MDTHYISSEPVSIDRIFSIIERGEQLALSKTSEAAIVKCRAFLDEAIPESKKPIYGVNTGFGSLCKIAIPQEELEQLQRNLIVSHASGVGPVVEEELIRLMILLKIQSLAHGHSGVRLATVQRLIDMFNNDVLPVIFEQGSLGASGDLCPLAHMSLPLIGEGEVIFKGKRMASIEAMRHFNWEPLVLGSKEGLALLNGTQFMSAHAVWCIAQSLRIGKAANIVAALSLDAWHCKAEPFDHRIHDLRKQVGQQDVAKQILQILEGSEMFHTDKEQVQDSYSFRCIPQVHGATKDVLSYCNDIISREINGVTDNPNIFPDEGMILSGGNFHGQPLALTLDFLAISVSELANISERRVYRLLSGSRGLPEFLTNGGGLHSGLMIPQYTAASLVSQNKQLCTPASVDSIPSCNEQEDHVSMGANAATKCKRVITNVWTVLAIEWLTAAQAMEFRRPSKTSPMLEDLLEKFRNEVPAQDGDRYLHPDIEASIRFLMNS